MKLWRHDVDNSGSCCIISNLIFLKTGFIASMPYLVKAFVGPTGGLIVDLMIKNGMSVRNARRLIFSIGMIVTNIYNYI